MRELIHGTARCAVLPIGLEPAPGNLGGSEQMPKRINWAWDGPFIMTDQREATYYVRARKDRQGWHIDVWRGDDCHMQAKAGKEPWVEWGMPGELPLDAAIMQTIIQQRGKP